MKRILILICVLSLLVASCHHKTIPQSSDSNLSGKSVTETGSASYYSDSFNGRKTANGELYNSSKFTAAHKRLPFGTIVTVTNIATGKSVTVRINDRGPFVAGRIIDLSRAAAKQIDMVNAGVVKVKIQYRK